MQTATIPASRPTTSPRPAAPPQMRAIVQRAYGGADALCAGTLDRPGIGPADVLVQVRAAGLDRGTWHLMAGLPYAVRLAGVGVRAPKSPVPGHDVAGAVDAVGHEVTRFEVGDAVFGIARGSFAEYAAAAQDKLALKPAGLTFEQAAAVPTTCSTTRARTSPTGRRRTTSSSTSAATPRCRACAARSPRTARSSSAAARAAGAGSAAAIASCGPSRCRRFCSQRLTTFICKEHFTGLERLASLIEDGAVVPVVERTFALEQAPDAMRHLVGGAARGKLVITVNGDCGE